MKVEMYTAFGFYDDICVYNDNADESNIFV